MRVDFTKILNYTILLYALLLPLSRGAIVGLTLFITIFWILEGNFKQKFKEILTCKFLLALLAFITFNFISLFWVESNNLSEAVSYIKKYWYLIIIFPLFTSIKKENIINILYMFLTGMAISMVLSWGIYFHWWEIKEVTKDSLSPFMYHVMYSVFLSIAALLSLNFIILNDRKSKKILFFILFLLFTILLFIGIGRTGEVIYIIGVYLILLKNIKNKLQTTLIVTMAMGILGFALYATNHNFKERIDFIKTDFVQLQNNNYCTSIGGRIVTWDISYNIVKNNPFLGVGIIDHSDYLKKSIRENKDYAKCPLLTKMDYFHAQFIEIVTQLGIIGFLIFISLFYILLNIKLNNKTMQNLNLILLTSTLLFFLVDMPFRRQFFIAFFALISGIIIAQLKHERELKK